MDLKDWMLERLLCVYVVLALPVSLVLYILLIHDL